LSSLLKGVQDAIKKVEPGVNLGDGEWQYENQQYEFEPLSNYIVTNVPDKPKIKNPMQSMAGQVGPELMKYKQDSVAENKFKLGDMI